jgi:acetyl esterase/lipase
MKLIAVVFTLSLGLFYTIAAVSPQRNSRAILTETPPSADAKIAYGQDPNQFGELRLPKGDQVKRPYPVVVLLHGGCWMAEYGLGYMGHAAADLASHGVATWNLEYRRVGNTGGGITGTSEDIQRGVAFLTTLAKKHSLDLQRIVVAGHSAGGHLALQLADTLQGKGWRGVIALAAITDLRRTGTACDANVPMLMGAAKYDAHSPLALLPLGSVKQIIVQGEADKIIPTAMATSYVEAAQKQGDDARLVLLKDAGHFEIVDPQAAAWARVRAEILRLLQ